MSHVICHFSPISLPVHDRLYLRCEGGRHWHHLRANIYWHILRERLILFPADLPHCQKWYSRHLPVWSLGLFFSFPSGVWTTTKASTSFLVLSSLTSVPRLFFQASGRARTCLDELVSNLWEFCLSPEVFSTADFFLVIILVTKKTKIEKDKLSLLSFHTVLSTF